MMIYFKASGLRLATLQVMRVPCPILVPINTPKLEHVTRLEAIANAPFVTVNFEVF